MDTAHKKDDEQTLVKNEGIEKNILTCKTNFWSMYFLAILGWNSWLSKKRMKNSYTSWEEKKNERVCYLEEFFELSMHAKKGKSSKVMV